MVERLRLNQHPDLQDFQAYVKRAAERNGSGIRDSTDALMLLVGQLGRLAKAVRKDTGVAVRTGSKIPTVAEELAGLLYRVANLANYLGIDLEEAFRNREKRFRRRKNRDR